MSDDPFSFQRFVAALDTFCGGRRDALTEELLDDAEA